MSQSKNIGDQIDKKLSTIKTIPKLQLESMGFGNLEVNQQDEDFLSKSSVSETDFQLLMKDNFFEIVKDIQDDLEN